MLLFAAQLADALVAVHGHATVDAAHFVVARTRSYTDDFAQYLIAVGSDRPFG